jgi:hypothetical protein
MKLKPLYYILLLALIIRLYHIDFPIGGKHGWRQADTAAIAKNYYLNGFNLFYPQVDWQGNLPGYIESEFQIYPYLVALLYSVFGLHDWIGRALSLFFFLLTIYGLYLLVRKVRDENSALWTAFVYAVLPANIFFSSVFMPEPLMLMSIVYGLYFFVNWIENEKETDFYLSAFFISISILVKIVTLYIGLPLLYLACQKYMTNLPSPLGRVGRGLKFLTSFKLWLYAALVLLPSAAWYYHAHMLLVNGGVTFNIWGFGTDKWGNFELLLSPSFYNGLFVGSIAESHLAYVGIIPLIIGLFLARKGRLERLFDFWIISVIIYFLIVADGNKTHDYYQLPFNLPAAFFIGKTFSCFISLQDIKTVFSRFNFKTIALSIIFILMMIGSYVKASRFYSSEDYNLPYFQIAEEVKKITAKDELIITICDHNPLLLYTCQRKGWAVKPHHLTDEFLKEKISLGVKVIACEKQYFKPKEDSLKLGELKSRFKVTKETPDYIIFLIN